MAAPALRPLGIGETLDVSIKIVTRNLGSLVKPVLAIVAPLTLVSTIVTSSAVSSSDFSGLTFDETTGTFEVDGGELWTTIAAVGVATMVSFVATLISTAACFKVITDAYLGRPVDWRGSVRYAARRVHSVLWITVLSVVLAGLGLILCVVPGIWFWFFFAVAVPVFLTEGTRGRKALGRSRRLVEGHWWHVFAVIVLGMILAGVVGGALTGLAAVFASSDSSSVGTIAVNWVTGTLASVLTTPFQAAVATVVYIDLRVRKEAFDLQLLAEQLGVEPSASFEATPYLPPPTPGGDGEQPPFWPPPPGWTPSRPADDREPDSPT